MPELAIEHNRYDGIITIPRIAIENVKSNPDGRPFIEAPLGDDSEFAIYFHLKGDDVDPSLINAARHLMFQIGQIDNLVQQACANECRKSGFHPRNFQGRLAYVTVSHEKAALSYWGTEVNTEWDEIAELRDEKWIYVGTALSK